MATITPTLNPTESGGSVTIVAGSFTGNTSDSHMVLAPSTGFVQSCVVSTPTEDATTPFVVLNATTGGGETFGTIQIKTATTGTYTFVAHVVGVV